MPIKAERGYVIPAINTETCDYESCADLLMRSIKSWHPDADITVMTKQDLPYGDLGGYANDWQVFAFSPYRQTIKLEADMFCSSPIDHWWSLFEKRDVVVSLGARDFYNNACQSRRYRKTFDANELPDIYNAITYWRLSKTSQQFFSLVEQIFKNWNAFKQLLKFPDDQASTDLVYALAAKMIGVEQVTLPPGVGPSIVHMKPGMIPTRSPDWRDELVWEIVNNTLRINTVSQWGLVHYHVKDWCHEQQ